MGPFDTAGRQLQLVSSSPAAGEIDVDPATGIVLELNVAVAGESVGGTAVRLFSGRIEVGGTTHVDQIARVITFTPSAALRPDLLHRVRVSDTIRGLDGSHFRERIVFEFRTGAAAAANHPPRAPQAPPAQPQGLWEDRCVDCHGATETGPPRAGLDLGSAERARAALVNVGSTEVPLLRVRPGDHARSYLIRKLLGHHGVAGMPMPPQPERRLDEAELRQVADWIDSGAD